MGILDKISDWIGTDEPVEKTSQAKEEAAGYNKPTVMNDDPASDTEWLAQKQTQVAIAASRAKMKKQLDTQQIQETVVCMQAEVPWTGAAGMILANIFMSSTSIKVVIRDTDGDQHAFEGDIVDFQGCRNGDDLMIRALGG